MLARNYVYYCGFSRKQFTKEKKKLILQLVSSIYLPMVLLKFQARALVGCQIQLHIQGVPTLHTFDRPHYMKNEKYMEKHMQESETFFYVFFFCNGAHQ